MQNSPPPVESPTSLWRSKPGIVLGMLLIIAVFYVARESLVHMSQAPALLDSAAVSLDAPI